MRVAGAIVNRTVPFEVESVRIPVDASNVSIVPFTLNVVEADDVDWGAAESTAAESRRMWRLLFITDL
jgi:hypothetical protein